MNIAQSLENSGLDLSLNQLKAFLLGGLSAKSALPLDKALEEIFAEEPEARAGLEKDIAELYENLKVTKKSELENLVNADLAASFEKLDFFLTGLSIAGTHTDSTEGELAEIIDDLEDLVMDIEEFLETESQDEQEELVDALLGTWDALVKQLN